ncbi:MULTISPECIES: hypothetical protein [unclassified Clostridium]|uniref:hypothetical protein n=1 Tax=unclassified Clostridium TaxID=2614128 RepID=UPI0025BD4C32|nr:MULTISPECIES: hypothetical protein [unclassified Clostridium]
MILNRTEQITYISVAEETYIYNKLNNIFTFVDANFEVTVYQLESKEDFKELYENQKVNFEIVGIEMPGDLNEWFIETYNKIR